MSFTIDINEVMRTSKRAQAQLARIPPALIPACTMAVANYLLNQIITKEIPAWKKIERIAIYGKHFKTKKQRLWFFWAKAHGIIDVPYRRRGKHGGIGTQWHIISATDGKNVILRNDDPAAQYVYGDTTQNRLIHAIGWKTIGQIAEEKSKNMGPVLKRAADKAIRDSLKRSDIVHGGIISL